MPTITVKLNKKRADRLARWARRRKVSKSEVIRVLIDRAAPIETGEDLIEFCFAAVAANRRPPVRPVLVDQCIPEQQCYEIASRLKDINVSVIDESAYPLVVEDCLMSPHSLRVPDKVKPWMIRYYSVRL